MGECVKLTQCANCEGRGKVVLMNSWFTADGFRRERCWICAGSGFSSYKPAPDVLAGQRRVESMSEADRSALRQEGE